MISLENKRLWLWISLILTLSFIAFGCVFVITSSLLVSRVKQFPPIETSVTTTCTIIDPNVNCQVQQVDLLHELDTSSSLTSAMPQQLLNRVKPNNENNENNEKPPLESLLITTKPSPIHAIASKLWENSHTSAASLIADNKGIQNEEILLKKNNHDLSSSITSQKTMVQGKCFALVQYETKNMDKEFPKLESVTYFPHSSSSPQSQYTKGQTVNCYFDGFRPQIVSYDMVKQQDEYSKFFNIMQIGYVELATAGCLFLTAMVCMGVSCCCSYMYKRTLREYAGLKATGSLP